MYMDLLLERVSSLKKLCPFTGSRVSLSVLKYFTLFLCICHWSIRNHGHISCKNKFQPRDYTHTHTHTHTHTRTYTSSGTWTAACFLWLYRFYRYFCDTNTTTHCCRFL